ncbi:MAG: DUF805 domain-containing protein [Saccharospirillaceae bacterium]|nr:DUF805 domain-containing protein [Pseudomonadales bacterium]NRB78266.1 DUF805 domain-containing protein [Saccharospirillaceae bacterium]
MNNILQAELRLLFGFSRLNRTRYIVYSFFCTLLPLAIFNLYFFNIIEFVYFGMTALRSSMILILLSILLSSFFSLKFTIQRFRDINSRSWWAITFFSPSFIFVFLILSSMKGDHYENRFGQQNNNTHKWVSILAVFIYFAIALVAVGYIVLSLYFSL